jgi:hypothetical protein
MTITSKPCGHRISGDEAGFQGHCLMAGSEHLMRVIDEWRKPHQTIRDVSLLKPALAPA